MSPGQGTREEDAPSSAAPWTSMFIGLEGVAVGRIGGKEVELREGQAMIVPPGTTHEWWNESEEQATALLLMFGPGA